MRKVRLKNVSGADILLLGFGAQKIADGTSEDVRGTQEQFDTDAQLIAAIDAGDIQVMDGATVVTDPAECHYHRKGEKVMHIVAGTDISVDETDPANPVVSFTGSAGGGVVDHQRDTGSTVGVQGNGVWETLRSLTTISLPAGTYLVLSDFVISTGGTNKGRTGGILVNGVRRSVQYSQVADDADSGYSAMHIVTLGAPGTITIDYQGMRDGSDITGKNANYAVLAV